MSGDSLQLLNIVVFLSKFLFTRTGFAGFPGSGNTMMRLLLEAATGGTKNNYDGDNGDFDDNDEYFRMQKYRMGRDIWNWQFC